MYEQYGMGQYPFPWGGVTPPPNWQPQTPLMQQIYLKETDTTGVSTVSEFEFKKVEAEAPQETQMFRNGNAIPGAHALDTVATVGDNVSQAFHAIVTVPKNAPTATLNFKSANATSVRVANVIVVKVA